MKIPEIKKSLDVYEQHFVDFARQYDIPNDFFLESDHFAVKCASEMDYLETCQEIGSVISGPLWEFEEGGRLLASGMLKGGAEIGGEQLRGRYLRIRPFKWVEIMQPRPGKETDEGYVEHTEFLYRDHFAVEAMLYARAVEGTERQSNPGHAWVNVPISSDGLLEIKFNDRVLADVVDEERMLGIVNAREVS